MLIYVSLKHMGNIKKKVKETPFWLEHTPRTLRELMEDAVHTCLASYRERKKSSASPTPLTEEQWEGMREVGKFAFGGFEDPREVNEDRAVQTAIAAVEDGLVRIFRGAEELTDLDQEIQITEGEVFTFIRLTMLSGRMW
ncbi:MAG: hypothetical protein IJW99_04265 [Clostridia bacterium]|nr:hypothetical protein [Clostridia bacterium]